MNPAFRFKKLQAIVDSVFVDKANRLLARIEANRPAGPINVLQYFTDMTLDVIGT